ncbi:aspartate dehydrogenase [Virgibacillus soli]|uniref:aspartate dehydrogenase n=1 Tax=Paracerasibacillus soli TaxID=480284 RepID=UPI0035EA0D8E
MIKIGLIGVGNLGQFLLEKINKEHILAGYTISAICDERVKAIHTMPALAKAYHVKAYDQLDDFLNADIDLVVECANVTAVQQYALQILAKKNLLAISVGAFVSSSFYEKVLATTQKQRTKLYLPAGAIGGLEVIQAAKVLGGLKAITITTRKPIHAFADIDTTKETIIFQGLAVEAIERFPQNANVAITLSLAGLGVQQTKVKIIADPTVSQNIHTIQASGAFGKMDITLENNPLPMNPKTSYLTALSIIATLKSLHEQVVIG